MRRAESGQRRARASQPSSGSQCREHAQAAVVSCCQSTVGTKIIADPEKCFQELISDKLLELFVG